MSGLNHLVNSDYSKPHGWLQGDQGPETDQGHYCGGGLASIKPIRIAETSAWARLPAPSFS